MTCLMRASIGEIASTAHGTGLMLDLLQRNARIAAAEGYPIPESVLEQNTKTLVDKSSTITASMLRDVERGGPVEADHVVGYLLDKARAHGIDETLHKICYTHLKAYEQRRAAGRL